LQKDDHTVLPATAAESATAEGPTMTQRLFDRRIDVLPDLVAFTASFFRRHGIDHALLVTVDFAIEELFTNMVKYGGSAAPVEVRLAPIPGGIEVRLTERDATDFDVTRAPVADVTAPAGAREPGGLGLHLTRRLVDAIEYDYSPDRRESRIIFRKTANATREGRNDDDDRIGR
jgi:serine/threonine-protein kinase RsbW